MLVFLNLIIVLKLQMIFLEVDDRDKQQHQILNFYQLLVQHQQLYFLSLILLFQYKCPLTQSNLLQKLHQVLDIQFLINDQLCTKTYDVNIYWTLYAKQVLNKIFFEFMSKKDNRNCKLRYLLIYHHFQHLKGAPIVKVSKIQHTTLRQNQNLQTPDIFFFGVLHIYLIFLNKIHHLNTSSNESELVIFLYSFENMFQEMKFPLLDICVSLNFLITLLPFLAQSLK